MKHLLKKKLTRLTVFVIAACMLFSVTAFAEDLVPQESSQAQTLENTGDMVALEATTKIAAADCTEIGTSSSFGTIYYYNIGDETTNLEFTDYAGKTTGLSIMGLYSSYAMVSNTNIVDVNNGFGTTYEQLSSDATNSLDSKAIEGLDFSNIYAVCIMDADYNMCIYVIQGKTSSSAVIPTPSKITFSVDSGYISGYEEDALTYYSSEYAPDDPNADSYGYIYPEKKMDVYTVTLYGTPDEVNIDFSEAALAYGYNSSGTYICSCGAEGDGSYASNGQVGQTAAKVYADASGSYPDYIYVQTPYDSSWTTENLYAIHFVNAYTFNAYYDGEMALTNIEYIPENYSYYDWMTKETVKVGTYVITIPNGCTEISLETSDNTLTYNYDKSGNYISGLYDDIYTGLKSFDIATDANKDGEYDYIQVQTPYDSSWNSTLLYTITFTSSDSSVTPDEDTDSVLGFDEAYDAMTKIVDSKLNDSVEETYKSSNDWLFLGLVRAGQKPNDEYVGILKDNIAPTPRMILALTAAGYDVTNFCEKNLLESFSDYDSVKSSGYITDLIFTLIALDSNAYDIPKAAEGKTQTERQQILSDILKEQEDNGCWGYTYGGTFYEDVDTTAEAITALAPYYNTNDDIKEAVDNAIAWLATQQGEDGSFNGNSCSTSQVIVALTSLGINPTTDERFVTGDANMIDALCSFITDDGFKYMATSRTADDLSTYEGYYAMVAYQRLLDGKTSLYDMTDVTVHANGHSYDDGVVTKKATCQEEGVMTYTCKECQETAVEPIAKTEHEYKDGVCIYCGEKDPSYTEPTKDTKEDTTTADKTTDKTTKAADKTTDKTPETADTNNTTLWIIIAALALASMTAAGIKSKKRYDR